MIRFFASTGHHQHGRFGDPGVTEALDVILFAADFTNRLLQFRLGDYYEGLTLSVTRAWGVAHQVEYAVNDLRRDWLVCKVAHHSALENNVCKFHVLPP